MTALATLRSSSLPLAFECPAAVYRNGIIIDPINDAATEGTAAHAVMRIIAERDLSNIDDIDIAGIAAEYNVDPDDLKSHALNGVWIWKKIRASFIGGAGELALSGEVGGINLTAHMDLFAEDTEDAAHGIDWKFGRLDRAYFHQIAGYMALVLKSRPHLKSVDFAIGWMRDREIETYRMDRAGLAAWEERVRAEIVGWDQKTYRPGGQCGHCPRSHDCPALAAAVRRDIAILEDGSMAARISEGLGDLAPPEIVSLYRRSKAVVSFCESFQKAVRDLATRTGAISDGSGSSLRYVDTAGSRVLDPMRAWPVLKERLNDDEISSAIKISVGKVEKILADKAGKGNGAQAKRELAAALDAASAVSKTPGQQFRDVRDGKE